MSEETSAPIPVVLSNEKPIPVVLSPGDKPISAVLPSWLLTALWRRYGPRRNGDGVLQTIPPAPPTQAALTLDSKTIGIIISVDTTGDVFYGWTNNLGNDVGGSGQTRLGSGNNYLLDNLNSADNPAIFLRCESSVGGVAVTLTPIQLDDESYPSSP